MNPLKLILFFWTFYGLVVDLEAIRCPKGQGQKRNKRECEVCTKGYFQSEDNSEKRCVQCRKCNEATGSMIVEACTAKSNRKCQCPKGSDRLEEDSVTCRCPIGHGLQNKECKKCQDGYFSDKDDSTCQKWRECPSGVKENGTNTKDVICKDPKITTDPTSNRTPSFTTRLVSTPQQTKATTAPPVASKDKETTSNSSYTGNHIGMALIILGIVGLLILTALTCKLRISACMQTKTNTRDSLCRKPVEESGDSSLTSLKPNPEEP